MNNDEFVDVQPWPIAELIGQLVTHVALGRRGLIENDSEAALFERETDRFELDAWGKLELTSWLTTTDSEILGAPIGSLTSDQIDRCTDSLIVASSVGWAVQVVNARRLPIVSDGTPEQRVIEWAPSPWTPVRNVVKGVRLRPDAELAAERERWELLYWRSALFTDAAFAVEDRQALAQTVQELDGLDLIPISGDDFALDDGTSFKELDGDTFDELAGQAESRLRTLNWVCGFGDSPITAPLDLDA